MSIGEECPELNEFTITSEDQDHTAEQADIIEFEFTGEVLDKKGTKPGEESIKEIKKEIDKMKEDVNNTVNELEEKEKVRQQICEDAYKTILTQKCVDSKDESTEETEEAGPLDDILDEDNKETK